MARVFQMVKQLGEDGKSRWVRAPKKYRGTATWFLDYQDAGGRRQTVACEAQTKAQAEALLSTKQSDNHKAAILGRQSTDGIKPVAFKTFFDDTYMDCSKERVRESTQTRKEQLGKHLVAFFGLTPLRAINAGSVTDFMTKRAKDGASVSERNRERALLSNIMAEAFRRELVDVNPVARVRPLRERNQRDLWLRPEDVTWLLKYAETWVKPFIIFACYTGLRLSELVNLVWAALEHSPGFVRVGSESKGGRTRFVPLRQEAKDVLKGLSRHIGETGEVPWVFYNARRKQPYRGNSVYHSFKRAAELAASKLDQQGQTEAAGRLRKACFHTLRHTFASWSIQGGELTDSEVQQYLGHSSDSMTRRYAHLECATVKQGGLDSLPTLPRVPELLDSCKMEVASNAKAV